MAADGIGMRASQEARWKRNVKETRERQRRLQKIEKEKQEKEDIKRKEALEQRRRDRAESDRHLRHPASKPPEPKKAILKKGAGVKRHGLRVKEVVRPTSPRTNAKQLQARLRDHIREQRQKVLLKKQSAADNEPVIENDGIDWRTARKMAAQRLDTLLHEVLPEAASDPATGNRDVQHSPSPQQHQAPRESEEFSFPQPNHDLNALLAEMGPPKATQAPAMQNIPADESTHGCEASSCQFTFGEGAPGPPEDDGAEQGDELRRGVTTAARHRVAPRVWPFRPGSLAEQEEPGQPAHQEPATACSDAATSSDQIHECHVDQELPMPDWARLVDQCSSAKQSLSVAEPHVEVPAWASVVRVSCAATEHAAYNPALSFPERDAILSAVPNEEDISGQCLKGKIPTGAAAPDFSMLDKTAALESSRDASSHTSVGDSAKSFDFGLVSSGRVTASGNFRAGTEASPGDAFASKGKSPQALQVSPSQHTVSRDAGASIRNGDEAGPGQRECTWTGSSMTPVYPKEIQDPVKHSGIPLTGDREVDYAGLETQQTLLAEAAANRGGAARSPAMPPAIQKGIPAQDEIKTDRTAPAHPGAHVIQQPVEMQRSACSKPASAEPSPGYADGMGVVRRHQPSLPRSDGTGQDLALTQHHKKSDDGIEGRRECKGSYAAAATTAQQREEREKQERQRLAAELAKRRAAVAAREAKEKEAKRPPKTQQPRGHYAVHVPGKAHPAPKPTPGSRAQDTPPQPGQHQPFYPPPAGMQAPSAWGAWPLPPPGYFAYPPAPPMPGMFVGASPSGIAASPHHSSQTEAASPLPPQRKNRHGRAPKKVEKDEIEAVRQLEMSIEISDGECSEDEQELPEDWEAQMAAAAPSKSKRVAAREPGCRPEGDRPHSSNFSRSPLAAALLELVGLPGMHGMDPLTRQVSGRILASHGEVQRQGSARVCTGLSLEEDALLKSLQRIDPNMLRKSLKSAGIFVEEDGSILTSTKQEQDLLYSLEELDRRLHAVRMDTCAEGHGHCNAQPGHVQQRAHEPEMQKGTAAPIHSRHSARKASRSPESRIPKPERRASASKGHQVREGSQREDQAGYSGRPTTISAGKQSVSISRPSLNRNGKPTQPPEGYTIAQEYKQQAPYSQAMPVFPMNGIPIQPHAMQQYDFFPGPPNGIQGHVPPAYPGFPVHHQQGRQPPGVMIRPADPSSELVLARQAHRDKSYNQYPMPGQQAPSAASSAQHGRIKMNKKMMGVLFE